MRETASCGRARSDSSAVGTVRDEASLASRPDITGANHGGHWRYAGITERRGKAGATPRRDRCAEIADAAAFRTGPVHDRNRPFAGRLYPGKPLARPPLREPGLRALLGSGAPQF